MSTLVRESDLISLHVPLTPQTDRIVDEDTLAVENVRRFVSKQDLLEGTVL